MKKSTAGIISTLVLIVFTAVGLRGPQPPSPAPADAPADVFSAARAHRHLEAIARQPHPMGTAEHRRVRAHIASELSALGLEPRLQEATVGTQSWMGAVFGHVVNVVARLEGSGDGPALLLMSHYDTVPHSPGAGDDSAGVAVMLETARALRQGTPPANDVIFLFTDGEEQGLLGARAFAEQHPWAADVGLLVNLEARGTRGPALMFETSAGNAPLISVFDRAVDDPAASSYSYEIYRRMPNDTDFSVFRQRQVPGLNFAFIHGGTAYHTAQDSLQRLDLASVQHMGDAALGLARAFGVADLEAPWSTADAIYFNPVSSVFVTYPRALVLPLAGLLLVATVVVLILGFRRDRLTAGGLAAGFVVQLVGAGVVGAVLGLAAGWVLGFYDFELWGGWASRPLILLGFGLVAIGLTIAAFRWLGGRVRPDNLWAGGLVVWLILTLDISIVAPGASYLYAWPLAAALGAAALAWKTAGNTAGNEVPVALLVTGALAAALTALLWAPTLSLVAVALGSVAAGLIGIAVFLLFFGPLAPVLLLTGEGRRRYLVPAAITVAGIALVIAVQVSSGFDADNRRPGSLFYALDTRTGEAQWMSFDRSLDDWSSRVFNAEPQRSESPSFVIFSRPLLASPAPAAPLPAPEVTWLGARDVEGGTAVDVSITWRYDVHRAILLASSESEIRAVASDGQRLPLERGRDGEDGHRHRVQFHAPPAGGLELTIELAEPKPLELEIIGQRYALPDLPGLEPRPAHLMPQMGWLSDSTFVTSVATWAPGSVSPPAEETAEEPAAVAAGAQ